MRSVCLPRHPALAYLFLVRWQDGAHLHVWTMTLLRIFSYAVVIFFVLSATVADAQDVESRQVVVQAEAGELPSAYGAPPDLSHGRISTLTKSYVLAPFNFEVEAGYEGDIFRHGLP